MNASPRLRIHRRGTDTPGAHVGDARLLWPGVAQALPPLDAELARTPYRADELVVLTEADPGTGDREATPRAGQVDVLRLRPALLSYPDAERLAGENGAPGLFASTETWMVALELGSPVSALGTAHESPEHWPHPPHDPDCPWPFPHPGWCRVGQPWWCQIFCLSGSCDDC